jgi:ABC-type nitrate/sulfonate/bicarbonate transport system substrate-binding protein
MNNTLIKLRIAGVPEHFNLPWLRLAESGALEARGLDLVWRDVPEGTGAMVAALNDGRLDAAVLLTEGAAAGLEAGGNFEPLGVYVETPLLWGIHVAADSSFNDVESMARARFAISRPGSGSHLMAFALADSRGWPSADLRFVSVGTLADAIESLGRRESDVFLWEKFMTQPIVDRGEFRRVGVFEAPWPAFVTVVANDAAAEVRSAVRLAHEEALEAAAALRQAPDAAQQIAERFGLGRDDVAAWLGVTRWARDVNRPTDAIAAARAALERAGAFA